MKKRNGEGREWIRFPVKIERNEGKNNVSNHANKNYKNEELRKCMKEAKHRVLKLLENWVDDWSIVVIIDVDGMVRKEDYGELKKRHIHQESYEEIE